MKNWNGTDIPATASKGGVVAFLNPYDNLIQTGVRPWPPAEIVQKLYQSSQVKAYNDVNKSYVTQCLGYYTDLQSINSEDALTWSVFGTVSYAPPGVKNTFITELFESLNLPAQRIVTSEIFLWRRIPHPDTLVSGGPEIDFGIHAGGVLLLGEAKWKSAVGKAQGKNKNKTQIQLRVEFLKKFGRKIYPDVRKFAVLGVGLRDDIVDSSDDDGVICCGTTWEDCVVESHPLHHELTRYLQWKKQLSCVT